jgi:hypothetical protein
MRSKPVAHLLSDLGVTKTYSRPYTSNDNPYSESQLFVQKFTKECFLLWMNTQKNVSLLCIGKE